MRSRPRSNSSSSDGSLAKGNRVLIVATDNTMQRVPQYIGQVGIVKEAPVHPCTWYKIKFDDGEVFTFRPSALVGVEADYNPETGEGTIHYRGNGHSIKHTSPEQPKSGASAEKHLLSPVKKIPPKWLSDLDGDAWVGAQVRITTGRMKGHEGVVLRSGNGWVQVETPTFGEVAKRAHELELIAYDTSKVHVKAASMFDGGIKRSHESMEDGAVRTSSGRQVRPRSYSDANSDDGRGRAAGGRTHSYDSSGTLLTTPSEQKQPSAPLIHPNIKEARNQYMQKYVKKMTEKLRHRPDLMYWTHMLKASHVLSGGLPDPALEQELARDFMDSVCSSCLKERWPAAKYCWNESCPASPVYYKLTGCPPPDCSTESAATSVKGRDIKGDIGVDANGEHVITITDDACPGDARFNALEHARLMKVRRHVESPLESSVVSTESSLPTVLFGGSSASADNWTQRTKADDLAGNVLVVETDKSSYKIPNSASARAMLVQKLVREGLTDSADRVCGDNWSVPEEPGSSNGTPVRISKVPAALTAVSSSQAPATFGEKVDHGGPQFTLPGLQLSGIGRSQADCPPLLPSILPSKSSEYRPVEAGSLLLSGNPAPGSASSNPHISPYLARGPDCFSFGTTNGLTAEAAKSPTAKAN